MKMQSIEQITGVSEETQQKEVVAHLKEVGSPLGQALGRLLGKVRAEEKTVPVKAPPSEAFVLTPQMRAEAAGRQRMFDAQLGEDK